MRQYLFILGLLVILTGCACRDCDGRYESNPVTGKDAFYSPYWDTPLNPCDSSPKTPS